MTYDQARLDAAFARAVREIHEDIANGRMPIDVDTFSRLHDYVDANEYGGLCQIDDLEGDELHDFANTLQNRVNDWLAAGRPMNPDGTAAEPAEPIETLVTIPGWTSATYVGGRIKRIVFCPSASDAGYFGPNAEVWSGDSNLDVEEIDGPFWRAVQNFLPHPDTPSICWEE